MDKKLEFLFFEKAWDVIQRDIIKKKPLIFFLLKLLVFSVTECYRVKPGQVEGSEKANHTLVLTPVIVLEWCLWGIGWPLLENS